MQQLAVRRRTLPDVLLGIEARLQNWALWSRRQAIIYEQCESLEGNYRSPQHWDKPPVNPPIRPEDRDAYEVSLAAASLRFRDHLTLKLGYVFGFEDYRVAKILTRELRQRVRTLDMINIYGEAKANLQIALKTGAVLRRVRTVDRIRLLLPRLVDPMID